ncbi:MAG: asparagine synthase (glutamine-hydrolyzing) [Sedimentisphaerales bacterium]
MCGIAGFNWSSQEAAEKMTVTLRHRGPDDNGIFTDTNVSLGHTRLSILDLSPKGHQPMESQDLVLVYNGEIYNFKELKNQLELKGYQFNSGTDTEVLLYSYHCWGPSCAEKFDGMWAFCIYDKKKNILFLSRDRFGIKPLYYYFDGSRFIFASEIKAIKTHNINLKIDTRAVNFFFYQKYIGNNLTIFKNCFKLRPSENLFFDLNRKEIRLEKYYNLLEDIAHHQAIPLEQRLESIESTLTQAVEERLVADVPVGSFLSGGIDSSLISAIISQRHKAFDTFSIGFKDESYDELKYSIFVSDYIHTKHHYEYMEVDENVLKFVLENMDEPFGDSSLLPTYLLSKITRQKVTVALSGDAGDEVFGGYDTYKGYKYAKYFPTALLKSARYCADLIAPSEKKVTFAFKTKRFLRDFEAEVNRRHLDWMATFNDLQRQKLLNQNFVPAESLIDCDYGTDLLSIQLNDIHNYLAEDILKKVDIASMLNSLEARVPFLDHQLLPLVLSLPEKYKISLFETKRILKKIAAKYLPENIIHRPKRGFTVPISKWIRQSELIGNFLTNADFYKHNFLNYDYVQTLFKSHTDKSQDNARELWLVFIFNYWMNKNSKYIR